MAREFTQINPNKGKYGEFNINKQGIRFILDSDSEPSLIVESLGVRGFSDARRFIDFIRPE